MLRTFTFIAAAARAFTFIAAALLEMSGSAQTRSTAAVPQPIAIVTTSAAASSNVTTIAHRDVGADLITTAAKAVEQAVSTRN